MAREIRPFNLDNLAANLEELFFNLTLRGDDEHYGRGINLDAQEIEVNAPSTPDTEFSVYHNLNRIADRFIVVAAFTSGSIYFSSSPETDDSIELKCTVPNGHFIILVY